MRPYDAGRAQFGMDLMWSRGGSLFKPVEQEGVQPPAQFLAPGPFGSWNGGLIDGVEAGGVTVGVRCALNNPLSIPSV